MDSFPGDNSWGKIHMLDLRNVLQHAQETGVAVGHFNIADLVLLKAVFAAARELNVPVLVGASEGERSSWELVPSQRS
jgi:fructose/tagatose bisphosphate aldolase